MATITSTIVPDPHLEWEREAAALWGQNPTDYDANDARMDQWLVLVGQIGATSACTVAGVVTQVRLAFHAARNGLESLELNIRGLENAAASLERLARKG